MTAALVGAGCLGRTPTVRVCGERATMLPYGIFGGLEQVSKNPSESRTCCALFVNIACVVVWDVVPAYCLAMGPK